jgi:hypothetical protein
MIAMIASVLLKKTPFLYTKIESGISVIDEVYNSENIIPFNGAK